MRNIFIVTHPEATHHVEGLVGGWYDAPLTPRGEDHAAQIAGSLAARGLNHPVALVASDLLRTRQTAAAIGSVLSLVPVLDADLRERCYGAAEGQPAGTAGFVPPPAEGDRLNHHDGVEGSETLGQVARRVYASFDRILAAGTGDCVIVGHGGSASFLVAAWIGMPLDTVGLVKFSLSPGGITHLHEDDLMHGRQVARLNDTSHLSDQ